MSSPILCEATDLFIASEQNVDIYISFFIFHLISFFIFMWYLKSLGEAGLTISPFSSWGRRAVKGPNKIQSVSGAQHVSLAS